MKESHLNYKKYNLDYTSDNLDYTVYNKNVYLIVTGSRYYIHLEKLNFT